MAGSIAKAYVQVIPSAQGIGNQLSNVFNGEMPGAGKKAGGLFSSGMVSKIKGAIAAAGLGKLLSDTLQAGAALQQSIGGIETLFKENAETVIANAEKAYKTAGMSANQYMETVTSFSASLLQSLGGDTAAAAAAADTALIDMADNANKMGTSMEAIQNAYQGFAKQNYTMLDNLKLGYGGTKTEMERLLADAQALSGIEYDIDNLSDVYSAIHVIQEEMGITGATAKEAATTFSGSLASMKAAFSDLLANLATGRDIGPSLEALGETVFNFAQNNLLPMVGNIFTALPEVISSTLGMAIRGLNLIADNADVIMQMGVDLVTNLSTSIVSALPYLAAAAVNIVTSIGSVIMETDWVDIAKTTIGQMKTSISSAASDILGTDGSIVESVTNSIETKLPDLLKKGETMINSVVSGIFQALPSLVESALSMCTSFINTILSNLPSILNTGKNILLNLVSGIRQSMPNIIVSAGEAVASLITGLANNLPAIITAGFDLITSLITGIGNAGPDLLAAAGTAANSIWNAIAGIDWRQLGSNLIQGLIGGISSMAGALWTAAVNAANVAMSALKSALGIASPSKRARDEVGKQIPPGVAVGVKANTKPLTDALREMSDMSLDTMQTDFALNKSLSTLSVMPVQTGVQNSHNNVDAVLTQIYNTMESWEETNTAMLEASVLTVRELIQTVLGLNINDQAIYNAYKRHETKMAIMRGV